MRRALVAALSIILVLLATATSRSGEDPLAALRRLERCERNLVSFAVALEMFAREHGGALPAHLDELRPEYLHARLECSGAAYGYESAGADFTLTCLHGNHEAVGLPSGWPRFTRSGGAVAPPGWPPGERRARDTLENLDQCQSNLRNLGVGLEMYRARRMVGEVPPSRDGAPLPTRLEALTPDEMSAVPVCPSSKLSYGYEAVGDRFTVFCAGAPHRRAGLAEGLPAWTSSGGLEGLPVDEAGTDAPPAAQLSWCRIHLKRLGTALEMYSTDNLGRYPTALAQLSPGYIQSLPTCPAAGRDTYSPGFVSRAVPDAYEFRCTGENHLAEGVPAGEPRYDSTSGLQGTSAFEALLARFREPSSDSGALAEAGLALSLSLGNRPQQMVWSTLRAEALSEEGRQLEARVLYGEALGLCEEQPGLASRQAVALLVGHGLCALRSDDLVGARRCLDRAALVGSHVEFEDPRERWETELLVAAESGRVYQAAGDLAAARRGLEAALGLAERLEDSQGLFQLGRELGDVAMKEGRFDEAEQRLQDSLREAEAFGDGASALRSAYSLALLHQARGQAAQALNALREAAELATRTLGEDHILTYGACMMLGDALMQFGRWDEAQEQFQKCEEALRPARPGDDPDARAGLAFLRAGLLNDRAICECFRHLGTGQGLDRARVFAERGLALDGGPLVRPNLLATRGLVSTLGADPAGAATAYREALAALPAADARRAQFLAGLGDALRCQGKLAEAEEALLEAASGGAEGGLGASLAWGRALVALGSQDRQAALTLAQRALDLQRSGLEEILVWGTESDRLRFLATDRPFDLAATLGEAPLLAELALQRKGVVLDSLLEDAGQPEARRTLLDQLAVLQGRRVQLEQQPTPSPQDERELEQIKHQVAALRLRLREDGDPPGRSALAVSPARVQAAVGPRRCLVEFLRYRHYLGKDDWEDRYGAVLLPPTAPPAWVPLGPAGALEAEVDAFRGSLVGGETPEKPLRALWTRVWQPVASALPAGTEEVLLVPDGALQKVSFAVLLDPSGAFLGEGLRVRYLASGRDLLRPDSPGEDGTWELFGAPRYGTGPLGFRPLEGTEVEVDRLRDLARSSRREPRVYLGLQASEAALSAVRSPEVLHLATHGFVLEEPAAAAAGSRAWRLSSGVPGMDRRFLVPADPMARSGVALSGASSASLTPEDTLPDSAGDGVVSARELARLDLRGTRLVTLSACDTGLGSVQLGEGVLGLRRAAAQAGASHALLTLWEVSDRRTPDLMVDFYRRYLIERDPARALAEVQRDWLRRLKEEGGLAEAVRIAGPFMVTSFCGAGD